MTTRLRLEREFWQATVTFGEQPPVSPAELVPLLGALDRVAPAAEIQWEMPALQGTAVQMPIALPPPFGMLQPDLITGTSSKGWQIHLAARHLIVRSQLSVEEAGVLRRRSKAAVLPTSREFSEVLYRMLELVPKTLLSAARRATLSLNYAMFTGPTYPGSWLPSGSHPHEYPAVDGPTYRLSQHDLRFETVDGLRLAWNDVARVGNWFGPDGILLHNAAIVRNVEMRTAVAEPAASPILPDISTAPAMKADELQRFFAHDGKLGVRRALEHLRASLPPEVEVDE